MTFEPKLYNPAAQTEEWLIEHFVVRTKMFERIFADLISSDMKHPEQHYLIQGQRGMGKTTLLLRLKYEIERTPELKEWLLPVFFNEESYDLTSLSSLWEKLLKYFDEFFPDGGNYYSATDQFIGSNEYEQLCFKLVLDILRQHDKKIVILFDNFGELFLDNLDERDSHRFREILMNCADLRVIAASAVVLESHNDYKAPFFDFFKIINLEGLKKAETIDLIKKLQEKSGDAKIDIEAYKARIETLTILTGGVIRTIIMIYEVLLHDHDGSALKDLETVLDRVTPLYKHRMEDLKPQQRRIMDVIAKNWDAISTKEIAEQIRENGKLVPSKLISAQLQELEKNGLIEKIKTSTKNNFYIVKERFFNIWYLMRHGDKNARSKVKWLTSFLETMYGDEKDGLNNFIHKYLSNLQTGNYHPSSAINMTNALVHTENIEPLYQARLLEVTAGIVSEAEVKYLPNVNDQAYQEALQKFNSDDPNTAIALLEGLPVKNKKIIYLLSAAYLINKKFDEVLDLLRGKEDQGSSLFLGIALTQKGETTSNEVHFLETGLQNKQCLVGFDQKWIMLVEDWARITLLILYFHDRSKKRKALKFALELDDKIITGNRLYRTLLQEWKITILVWNDDFETANELVKEIEVVDDIDLNAAAPMVLLILAKKQYHTALQLFNNPKHNLKERLKPTYYALMYLLKDEYPDEYIKMGKELEEPVRDILKKVEQWAIDYA